MPVPSSGASQRASGRRREIVLRQRYGLLLACVFVLFFVMGVAPGGPWQDALITALAAATLILALRAGEVTPRTTAAATVIGVMLVLIVVVLAAAGVTNSATSRITAFALVAIAPPAIIVVSFTTLTTVGYGDLTARSNLGHTIAVSEALIGQIYLVTVVAVLVSGLARTRS